MNKKSAFAQFADAAAGFADIAAAQYRDYWEHENEKLRNEQAQIRAWQAQQAENDYLANVYPATANLLMAAINDTAAITYLLTIPSIDKLYAVTKLTRLADGNPALVYRWWIHPGVPVSTQKTIRNILQKQLNVLTAGCEFPALGIAVTLCADNEVFFLIKFRDNAPQGGQR